MPGLFYAPKIRLVQALLVVVILGAVILGLYLRPLGAADWQVALLGALAAWSTGVIGLSAGVGALRDSANIIAFFFGLMLIAAGAEALGLYAQAGAFLRRVAPGRRRLLAILCLGSVITAALSNDATPLVLTPAIFAAGSELGFRRDAAFAATFVADGASLLLPVSNPVNLLFYERFHLGQGTYLSTVTPAAAAGLAGLVIVTILRKPGARAGFQSPQPLPDVSVQASAFAAVGLLICGYITAGALGLPLGYVAVGGGALLFLVARASGTIDWRRYRKHVAPGVLVFVASLLLLVECVEGAGLLGPVRDQLLDLEGGPDIVAVLGSAMLAALLANLVNNWPSALFLATVIAGTPGEHAPLVAGCLIGSTIGANFTLVGSLSTVFWLSLARREGLIVSGGEYARRAFLPTACALCVASFVAALLV